MSYALYNNLGGLRFWRQNEIRARERIKSHLYDTVEQSLLNLNQMWRFEEVDTPVIMPIDMFSCAYGEDDIFTLENPLALRAETTIGSYKIAEHLMKKTKMKPPLCVWTLGKSFRREQTDGATAAKLRFNEFYQLEFQCIYSEGTNAPIAQTLRDSLVNAVEKITDLEARLINSERLPEYSKETVDIEVFWTSPTGISRWTEVASTSIRNDFPLIEGQRPCEVFEVAFGMDRMVITSQGEL